MAVLLALVVIAAFSRRWPGCAPRKGPPTDQRDWRAWYKNLKSWSDINVHVYREPPFNWLHPVSDECWTRRIKTTFALYTVISISTIIKLNDAFIWHAELHQSGASRLWHVSPIQAFRRLWETSHTMLPVIYPANNNNNQAHPCYVNCNPSKTTQSQITLRGKLWTCQAVIPTMQQFFSSLHLYDIFWITALPLF